MLWCLARYSFHAHEVRRQRLFPHLGVDGVSLDFLTCFALKCRDICPGHKVETRPRVSLGTQPHVFSSSGCVALIMVWKQK